MDSSIFKAYDIRGLYPSQINEPAALAIGQAIAQFLAPKTVLVGQDCRLSSPALVRALMDGLILQGVNVIDIGLCSTSLFYFACGSIKADVGIMVTASHNPKDYNGFKICKNGTVPVGGDSGLAEIKELALQNKFTSAVSKGKISEKNFFENYKEFFQKKFGSNHSTLKIITDTANAMGYFEVQILEQLVLCEKMFFELDGTFPNHPANPLEYENLAPLQQKVLSEKADLGIAFDGDADRVFFVDECGQIVASDLMVALLARFFPNETVLFDLRSSKTVSEQIKKFGGTPQKTRVGHAFIKKQMREQNAAFAGELSGHYYFREMFFAENSLYAALLALQLLKQEQKPLSELVLSVKTFFASGEINFEVKNKDEKIKELELTYKDSAKTIEYLDGITVEFENWWFNVRSSNTEPLLRLNLEADSQERCDQKTAEVLAIIRQFR